MSATTHSLLWSATGWQPECDPPSNVGRRLHDLVGAAGCVPLARTEATQTWTILPPRCVAGTACFCFSMESLADDLVATGRLTTDDRQRFVSTIHNAARRGQFFMSLTMSGVVAVAPEVSRLI